MESTLTKLTKSVEREEGAPSQSIYSGNGFGYVNRGREEPTYSLEQTQLILQRAQRHKIAQETERTERTQQGALENYLGEKRVSEGISLSTIYEVARQNMGLASEDVDWALKNCAISPERVKELLTENGVTDSSDIYHKKKKQRSKYFMREFSERISRETTSMLEEKIGGSFSHKLKSKLNLMKFFDGKIPFYKGATFYANEETEGRKKKRKLAEIDFDRSCTGPSVYVRVCDPIFLEILKEWKEVYQRISSVESERGNLNYMGISLHIENEIDLS